jgi:hypothetical protein
MQSLESEKRNVRHKFLISNLLQYLKGTVERNNLPPIFHRQTPPKPLSRYLKTFRNWLQFDEIFAVLIDSPLLLTAESRYSPYESCDSSHHSPAGNHFLLELSA